MSRLVFSVSRLQIRSSVVVVVVVVASSIATTTALSVAATTFRRRLVAVVVVVIISSGGRCRSFELHQSRSKASTHHVAPFLFAARSSRSGRSSNAAADGGWGCRR